MWPRITITAIAMLAFFAGTVVSFLTLPLWVTFAINVAREGSPADWLGFTGSTVGAFMTLVAAAFAWMAVQRQIKAQEEIARSQNEMQRLAILRERLTIIEDDKRAVSNIHTVVPAIGSIPEIVFAGGTITNEFGDFAERQFEKYSEQLEKAVTEFEIIGARRRSITIHAVERSEIGLAVATFQSEVLDARKDIFAARRQNPQEATVPSSVLQLSSAAKRVQGKCAEYNAKMFEEIARLEQLVEASAKSVGL